MLVLMPSCYTSTPSISLGHTSTSYVDVDLTDLIERAQFALNAKIYRPGEFEELEKLGFEGSWLQWFLFEIECFHGESSLAFPLVFPLCFLLVFEGLWTRRCGRVNGELIMRIFGWWLVVVARARRYTR
jgi:chorismate mutase